MYKVFIYNKPIYLTDDHHILNTLKQSSIYTCENQDDKEAILTIHQKTPDSDCLYVFNEDLEKLWNIFFKDFKEIDAAGGVVKNSDGEVLFIYRNDVWDLPKGKVERNEPIDEAAVREVEEECGIIGPVIKDQLIITYHTYATKTKNYIKRTYWYLMNYDSRNNTTELTPQLEEGITEVIWATSDQFESLLSNTYGSIVDVIDAYKNSSLK